MQAVLLATPALAKLHLGPEQGVSPSVCSSPIGTTDRGEWDHDEFEGLTFEKNFEFDYHVDTSELLNDQAIIP